MEHPLLDLVHYIEALLYCVCQALEILNSQATFRRGYYLYFTDEQNEAELNAGVRNETQLPSVPKPLSTTHAMASKSGDEGGQPVRRQEGGMRSGQGPEELEGPEQPAGALQGV
ncbi:unnamed protein product [Pipistrellus nathusii]|uniref:Uncharacterized protein n=1 Tax=Pipistrellus nathusii TaxID=59473 RepID=A0ABN9Z5M0_PIPNA